MNKRVIKVPDLFTRDSEVCYGVIEVYPQEADGKDLTSNKAEKFEKLVPAMRAICYNAPNMYKALRQIIRMAKDGSSNDDIIVLAQKMVGAIEQSYSAYKASQFEEN
jgi:hypothetical protein